MLKDTLQKDMITAFKAGESLKKTTLSMVIAAIKNREVDKRGALSKKGVAEADIDAQSALTDQEVLEVLSSEVKKRKDSAEQFRAGNRPELAEKEESEIVILQAYLPTQLTEAETRTEVETILKEIGISDPKDTGKAMSAVMAKLKGRADGTMVSTIVREMLTK
jgi:uncharacterized protein YqeY